MKKLVIFIFLLASYSGKAQIVVFGGTGFYNNASLKSSLYEGSKRFDRRLYAGAGFEFKISGKGLALIPYTGMSFAMGQNYDALYDLKRYAAGVFLRFYPFNANGDCGCPDFSLRNKFFEKHFFIFVDISGGYNRKSLELDDKQYEYYNPDFKTGLGAGLSIPFVKNVILDLAAGYSVTANDKWGADLLNGDAEAGFIPSAWDVLLFCKYFFNK